MAAPVAMGGVPQLRKKVRKAKMGVMSAVVDCFCGTDAVAWLVERGAAASAEDAQQKLQGWLRDGLVRAVNTDKEEALASLQAVMNGTYRFGKTVNVAAAGQQRNNEEKKKPKKQKPQFRAARDQYQDLSEGNALLLKMCEN